MIPLFGWLVAGDPAAQARPRVPLLEDRFERAAALVVGGVERRDRRAALVRFGARNLRSIADLCAVVGRMRWRRVALRDTNSGVAARDALARTPRGTVRFAISVLEIPDPAAHYLRGRSRQALRTNLGHALSAGITCHDLPDEAQRRQHFSEMLIRDDPTVKDPNWIDDLSTSEVLECYAATNPAGETLVVAALIIADEWAVLTCFLRHPKRKHAADARYLLQEHIVEALAAAGVRFLAVDSALRLPRGLRYYQHLLGFQPVNLHITPPPLLCDIRVAGATPMSHRGRHSSPYVT